MEALLSISNLHVHYGGVNALRGISLNVQEGEIVTIIGANGAGKSTLLNSISGVVHYEGDIHYSGQPLPTKSHQVAAKGVVQVPEGRQVFANLTVLGNLQIGSFLRKDAPGIARDLEYVYSVFPRLKERQSQFSGSLSGGEQQMLVIGRALMSHPKVILMDEPSLGLAPLLVTEIFNIIRKINQEGVTILLVEQNARKALAVANRAYVLEVGEIIREGKGQELLNDPVVQEAYLGTTKKAVAPGAD